MPTFPIMFDGSAAYLFNRPTLLCSLNSTLCSSRSLKKIVVFGSLVLMFVQTVGIGINIFGLTD
jgi:hypothetical protein